MISWSIHSHLKRIRRENNIVSPPAIGMYGKIKQEQTTNHENAIQQSVSQEAAKAQCGNRDSPQPGLDGKASRRGSLVLMKVIAVSRVLFFRPTPLGFRQVVPHVQLHVA